MNIKKPDNLRRTEIIQIRVSPEEQALISKVAYSNSLSIAPFIRYHILKISKEDSQTPK